MAEYWKEPPKFVVRMVLAVPAAVILLIVMTLRKRALNEQVDRWRRRALDATGARFTMTASSVTARTSHGGTYRTPRRWIAR
jgi:hypothetical protein